MEESTFDLAKKFMKGISAYQLFNTCLLWVFSLVKNFYLIKFFPKIAELTKSKVVCSIHIRYYVYNATPA